MLITLCRCNVMLGIRHPMIDSAHPRRGDSKRHLFDFENRRSHRQSNLISAPYEGRTSNSTAEARFSVFQFKLSTPPTLRLSLRSMRRDERAEKNTEQNIQKFVRLGGFSYLGRRFEVASLTTTRRSEVGGTRWLNGARESSGHLGIHVVFLFVYIFIYFLCLSE